MNAPVVFIDTETTGVHPGRQVWEVALIRRDPGKPDDEQSFFVDVDLSEADPFGLSVGRFYDRHPKGRRLAGLATANKPRPKTPAEAAQVIARVTHGAHLVGAVPNFDAGVFDKLLRDHRVIPSWHYHLIDVEALAVGYLRGLAEHEGYTSMPLPWKSDELSRACGVKPPADEERHTALGDARWAMRLYDAVTGAGNPNRKGASE